MNDFQTWLYDHYIWPQIESQPMDDGEKFRASLLDTGTTEAEKEDVAAVVRFYASHAFLLGLRSGIGLAPTVHFRSSSR